MKTARAKTLATAAATCALLVACQALVGIEDDQGIARIEDSGPTSDGAADDVYDSGCFPRKPPPPVDASLSTGTLRLAFTKIIVDPDAGTPLPRIGYDLDDRCTDLSALPKHEPPCRGSAADPIDGVDNAFLSIVNAFGLSSSDTYDPKAATFNKTIATGQGGTMLAIVGYDGNAHDVAAVQVGLGGLTGLEADGGTPKSDGTDRWFFDPSMFANGVPAGLTTGYIANDVLVLVRPSGFEFVLGEFRLPLTSAVLSAKIVREDGGVIALREGTIAGRASAKDLIHAAAAVLIDNKPLCENGLTPVLRTTVCGARDIPLDPFGDGKDTTCDAVSLGIGFEAITAELSATGQAAPPYPCEATPSCDTD